MGDACRQLTQRGHFFGLDKLVLSGLQVVECTFQ